MQVNTEKWGNSAEWLINTDLSDTNWQDTNLLFYDGKYRTLNDYRTNGVFDYNTHIDYSICYAAHAAAEKMPLADIALYDYQGNKRGEQTETNGFFFGVNSGVSSDAWFYFRELSGYISGNSASTSIAGTSMWSPNGINYSDEYPRPSNLHRYIQPIVQFSPKSAFYVIYVELVRNDYQSMTIVSLKTLKNNIATYADNYFIHRAYMLAYCYNGRVSQDGNYNNYARKTPHNAGVSTINNIKLLNSDKAITTYEQTIGSQFCLPIMGTVESVKGYRATDSNQYYGCIIAPHDSNNSETWALAVSADKINSVTVTYHRTNAYGYIYLLHTKISITADIVEDIMRGAAAYGLFFSDDVNGLNVDTTNIARWLNDKMYCGVLDDNDIGHGDYTHGFANAQNKIFTWDTSQNSNYDPSRPPTPTDPNTYSVTTGFNTVGNVASTTKAYVVNAAALTGLSGEMWSIINSLVTTPDDMTNLDNLTLDAFLTNNPIDAIVSVKKFPLLSVPHAENLENIYLGKYQTGAAGYALALQQARYNFEGIPIFPKFGNCFLDYAPYTKMQLYVPFCGTIDIDAADFMGRTLSVEMAIDFITGAVTAYVLANQLVVTSLTGNCGIDIAITGTEQSTVSAALENAIIQDKSARGSYTLKGSVGGMLTNPIGNLTHPTSAIENRFNTKLQRMKTNYDLQHVEMPLRQIGQASPLNSWALEFVCRLIIYYPDGECITFNATNEPTLITDKVESFGAVNGFATVETNVLSNFTGYTQVSDADLSGISATDTEKEMILSLLQSGEYL